MKTYLSLRMATIATLWFTGWAGAAEPATPRTYCRFVPERSDFAWENDKVAFRAYGPALRNSREDSGIDCWLKRVEYPIIDKWYAADRTGRSYHRDWGEGYDPYHVGSSRGCGGLGLWINGRLVVSNTFTAWRILRNEPEGSVFVLTYEWSVGSDAYREEKQISFRMGERLFRSTSTFWKNGELAAGLPVAIGLATHGGRAVVSGDRSKGWMACWEQIDGYGLGTGVMMKPSAILKFMETPGKGEAAHLLLITRTDHRGQVEYRAGYGWEKAWEIKTSKDWNAYLEQQVERNAWSTLPNPAEVKALTRKVADWQIATFEEHYKYRALSQYRMEQEENSGKPLGRKHDLAWEKGVLYIGMDRWRRVADQPEKYTDWLWMIGERNGWELHKRPYFADDHTVGQFYLSLYEEFKDPALLAPVKERFDWILAYPKTGSLVWDEETDCHSRWCWCDALFMAPPVWARLAKVTGEWKYLDFMDREYHATYDLLWDPENHLFFRDTRYFSRREKNGRKVYWARGNGWVFGGLALMIPDLPEEWPGRMFYVDLFKQMAENLVTCQREDGTWSMGLLGGVEGYPIKESSGTAFYAFGMAWGVNNGLLDRATYEPIIFRAWNALGECVADDGLLGYVQPVGEAPGDAYADKSELYGVGAFLSAGSEIWKLLHSR